ncbi:hypothetical protein AWV79_31530 [Cupriavidus sp. UYMMa02A]|nr:hypothetical protein AWV79_31530 [Cupriavidus sp. UYMMa02A]
MTRLLRATTRSHWIATLLMCAALSACGGSDDSASGGSQNPAGTQPSGEGAINQPPVVKPAIRCAP